MNNKISNPLLKQLISEISSNANKGRISVDWGIVNEAKKKKNVKEVDGKKPAPAATGDDDVAALLGGTDETPEDAGQKKPAAGSAKAPDQAGSAPKESPPAPDGDASTEDANKAEEDAAKAKAKLEKAKAELNKAEKEIKKKSYINLGSGAGVQYLLGKVLDQAFKTNTIDTLAADMVSALKVETPEDMDNFSDDVVTYMTIPGMPRLLEKMRTLANKTPEQTPEQTPEPTA